MMEDNRKELVRAFEKAFDAEIDEFIAAAEKEPHEFSKEFESKMAELIRTGKPNNKTVSRKRARRIVLIAIAAVLALALAACAIPEVREFIAGFFVQHKDDHDEYAEPEVTKERIEEEYGLVPIPEGFAEADVKRNDTSIVTIYINEDGDIIMLNQIAQPSYKQMIDNENGKFENKTIGDLSVRVYVSNESTQASWIKDGYYFSLSYPAPIEQQVFESWIASIKIK